MQSTAPIGTTSTAMSTTAAPTTDLAALVDLATPELEQIVSRGVRTFMEVGTALKVLHARRAYVDRGYFSFDDYCRALWGFSRQHGHRLITAVETAAALTVTNGDTDDDPPPPPPANEAQMRALAPLKDQPAVLAEVWRRAVAAAPGGDPKAITARHITKVRKAYEAEQAQAWQVARAAQVEAAQRADRAWAEEQHRRFEEQEQRLQEEQASVERNAGQQAEAAEPVGEPTLGELVPPDFELPPGRLTPIQKGAFAVGRIHVVTKFRPEEMVDAFFEVEGLCHDPKFCARQLENIRELISWLGEVGGLLAFRVIGPRLVAVARGEEDG